MLATHNGKKYLSDQLEALSHLKNVNVTLFISDDCSSDGTLLYTIKKSQLLGLKFHIINSSLSFGTPGSNFFSTLFQRFALLILIIFLL